MITYEIPEAPDELLDLAVEYIHEYGWTQGELKNLRNGSVCVMGALVLGRTYGLHQRQDTYRAAYGAVVNCLSGMYGGHVTIPEWNDEVCKDADDAVHLLKKAKEFL